MKKTLTPLDVARALGIPRGAVYRALNRGEIPSLRIGRKFLIPEAALDRVLLCQMPPPAGAQTTAEPQR